MKAVPRRLLVLGGGPVGVEMAQAVRRLGGEVVLVEGAEHVLPREPAPLGEALGEVLGADGIELVLGMHAAAARRDGEDYVLEFDDGRELRGDRLLVATGRRPRVEGIGLETVGIEADAPRGPRRRATFAPASACGRSATSTGSGPSPTSASTRARSSPPTSSASRARPTTRPCRASSSPTRRRRRRGDTEAPFSATARLAEVAKLETYTRAYAKSNGFLTLLSDGERLTGAYALGPEAGEWLQQATLAIRARVPLEVLRDTIQPFPTFSEIYVAALKALRAEIMSKQQRPVGRPTPLHHARRRRRLERTMRSDIAPGATFPDYELPDHDETSRAGSASCRATIPLILTLARGHYCPKEHQQHLELAAFYPEVAVAYTQVATIATDEHHELQEFRASVGAQWTFLSDPGRIVQQDLDIQEYTDPEHDPMIPHTLVLKPGLVVHSIYNGYWFWGRPSVDDLWRDLRGGQQRDPPRLGPQRPGLREAWDAGDRSPFHGWNKRDAGSRTAEESRAYVTASGGSASS